MDTATLAPPVVSASIDLSSPAFVIPDPTVLDLGDVPVLGGAATDELLDQSLREYKTFLESTRQHSGQ